MDSHFLCSFGKFGQILVYIAYPLLCIPFFVAVVADEKIVKNKHFSQNSPSQKKHESFPVYHPCVCDL